MSKRGSLKYQITQSLINQRRFGESKYKAKQEQGIKFGQAVDGIFSYKTMKAYLDEAVKFVNWVKENYKEVKTLEEAKKYAGKYLESNKHKNYSAWTLKLQRSALRKAFRDPELAKEVELPIRRKINIVRSRRSAVRDKNFSESRNRDLITFAKATGLRRKGLSRVRVQDVFEREGRLFVAIREKGGRYREAPVLQKYTERVKEIINKKGVEDKIFEKVPSCADIHSYRREYARELYKELTGGNYSENKDKEAVMRVSEALGHSRIDVVTRYYL
ncbi:site-specific integrase [Peptococcaceae bacterium]|nr:site-specific integrase [Peptococcaceae bacterium]